MKAGNTVEVGPTSLLPLPHLPPLTELGSDLQMGLTLSGVFLSPPTPDLAVCSPLPRPSSRALWGSLPDLGPGLW